MDMTDDRRLGVAVGGHVRADTAAETGNSKALKLQYVFISSKNTYFSDTS